MLRIQMESYLNSKCVFMFKKIQLSVCFINYDDIWGSGGIASPLLTSALDGDESVAPRPSRFTPG
jgi:hypothetical protein